MRTSWLAVLFILVSCASVRYAASDISKKYFPRISEEKVQILRSETPRRQYIEIGTVIASGTYNAAVKLMRREAAKQGGDAIIRFEARNNALSGTVIRFNE